MIIHTDQPINHPNEDRLNRSRLVGNIADHIGKSNSEYTLGLMGPWGSGKTSVLNLLEFELKRRGGYKVIRFNPWLFAGSHELVGQFFAELSSQLKNDKSLGQANVITDICDQLEKYSAIVSPATLAAAPYSGMAAFWVGVYSAFSAYRKLQQERFSNSVIAQRKLISDSLDKLNLKIVVMIDDVDRLSTAEMKDVLRLVRLVGDFPKTTYILSCDRTRVERALTDDGGQSYMEKIVQTPYELPAVDTLVLRDFFTTELEHVLNDAAHSELDSEDWQNYFALGLAPLIQTPRQIKRVANALRLTLSEIGEEVAIADVIALETIRILLPPLFEKISEFKDLLAPGAYDLANNEHGRPNSENSQRFTEVIGSVPEHRRIATQLVTRLFPATRRYSDNTTFGSEWLKPWRKKRRVAHHEILGLYLKRIPPKDGILPSQIDHIYKTMTDPAAFAAQIEPMDASTFESVLGRLEDYEDEFSASAAEPAVEVILKRADILRTERKYMGDFGADLAVTRIVLRLLRRAGGKKEVLNITERLLGKVPSLSWKLELIETVGHRANKGHKLIEEADYLKLKAILATSIGSADSEALARERDVARIFYFAKEMSVSEAILEGHLRNDSVFMSLLRKSSGKTYSQTVGDAATRVKTEISWKFLEDLCGGPEKLKSRIKELVGRFASSPDDEIFRLAVQYAEGKQPASSDDLD